MSRLASLALVRVSLFFCSPFFPSFLFFSLPFLLIVASYGSLV